MWVKELLKRSIREGNPSKLTRVDLQSDELLTAGSGVKKIGTRQAAEGRKGNGHKVAQLKKKKKKQRRNLVPMIKQQTTLEAKRDAGRHQNKQHFLFL